MSFDDRAAAAFSTASDTTRHLLSLATGATGAAIALFDDDKTPGIAFGPQGLSVEIGLALLALSVVSGLMTMGALVGQLGSDKAVPTVYGAGVRLFYAVQLATFGGGIIALVAAALN